MRKDIRTKKDEDIKKAAFDHFYDQGNVATADEQEIQSDSATTE